MNRIDFLIAQSEEAIDLANNLHSRIMEAKRIGNQALTRSIIETGSMQIEALKLQHQSELTLFEQKEYAQRVDRLKESIRL